MPSSWDSSCKNLRDFPKDSFMIFFFVDSSYDPFRNFIWDSSGYSCFNSSGFNAEMPSGIPTEISHAMFLGFAPDILSVLVS